MTKVLFFLFISIVYDIVLMTNLSDDVLNDLEPVINPTMTKVNYVSSSASNYYFACKLGFFFPWGHSLCLLTQSLHPVPSCHTVI